MQKVSCADDVMASCEQPILTDTAEGATGWMMGRARSSVQLGPRPSRTPLYAKENDTPAPHTLLRGHQRSPWHDGMSPGACALTRTGAVLVVHCLQPLLLLNDDDEPVKGRSARRPPPTASSLLRASGYDEIYPYHVAFYEGTCP